MTIPSAYESANGTITILETLLNTPCPPPFIYLHHPHHPSTALPLPTLSISDETGSSCAAIAQVDAIECHNPRLLFSAIGSRLRDALEVDGEEGEISTVDGFVRHIRTIWDTRIGARSGSSSRSVMGATSAHMNKGKRKADAMHSGVNGNEEVNRQRQEGEKALVILVTKAERLGKVLGPGWSVMTRLAELTGLPLCVVLASGVPWDELRPHRGDALEPIHLYLPAPSRDDILRELLPTSSHPLYPRFLDLLLSSVLPITSSPHDIEYLATLLWPIYTALLPPHAEQHLLASERPYPDPELSEANTEQPPPLVITVKLLTDLKHQLSLPMAAAIEAVLTRQTGYQQFQRAMMPSATGFASNSNKRVVPRPPALELSLCAKYLIVAAYCASYNPPKSDLRLFGRGTGPEGKRKKGGGTRRAGYGRVRLGKVAQRLLGPKPFPLDRLLAIFASLYAEHAERPDDLAPTLDDSEDSGDEYSTVAQRLARVEKRRRKDAEREERWDDEVDHLTMSVRLWALVPELEAQGLLKRASPADRLDNVMLRCEVDYELAKECARELKITLDEYMYEAVQ